MASVLRSVGHEDRLSIIDHLDELRSRLVVCLFALTVAFAFCFWQYGPLMSVLNEPLKLAGNPSSGTAGSVSNTAEVGIRLGKELGAAADAATALAGSSSTPAGQKADFTNLANSLNQAAADLPRVTPPRQPVTMGVGEPFTATMKVSAYFAILFALPVILWQIYAFILPAFSARERRIVFPLMLMIPVLFIAGVAFGYFLVLPPAVSFLQNFNSGSFDILVQAKDYYGFVVTVLVSLGLMFQIPVGLMALNRAGLVSSSALIRHWRYIVVGIAVLAAALPGVDPVTTLLEMAPLLVLYGLSILLLKLAERRDGETADGSGWALHLDDPNVDQDPPTAIQSDTTSDNRHPHEEDLSD